MHRAESNLPGTDQRGTSEQANTSSTPAATDHIELAEIADHQHLGPLLARWHVDEWGHLYNGWTLDVAEAEFRDMDVPGRIPITWVAFRGDGRGAEDVLGSISLLADDDLEGFRHLHPWLASLYVVPEERGRGVGRLLVDHLMAEAAVLGVERVHLFTAGQEEYYDRLGWRTVARPVVRGQQAAVMVRDTDRFAPRRAKASGWCRNPDIASAYSYLRPGGTPDDRDRLAEPIARGLYLAGEATWSPHPGTMHGAWFSGERAAAAIVAERAATAPSGERAAAPSGERAASAPAAERAATAPAAEAATAGPDQHSRRHPTVVVIGAGLAGLGAAKTLLGAGCDAVVLEADTVAGGRVATDTSLGGPIHLGASWLHGEIGNPIAEAAAAVGVPYTPTVWSVRPTYVVGRGRLPDVERDRIAVLHDLIENELEAASQRAAETEVFGPLVRQLIDQRQDGPLDRMVLNCWFRIAYEGMYAATLDDLSLAHYAEPFHLPGHNQLVEGSLGRVVEHLARGLDVRYGQRVLSVKGLPHHAESHHAEARWAIETETATFEADWVVVTTPVGALQAGRIRFDPPLPADVTAALHRIGPGRAAKVFVTFDEAFWSPERSFWLAAEEPVELGLWVDVSTLAGRPTLCGFATSNHVPAVEAMSEDELCGLAHRLLRDAGVLPEGRRGEASALLRPPV